MKYYIIAGEASGDLHGSNLIKELHRADPGATMRCWGGDLMKAAGGTLVKHYRELAFMGFIEVIQNIRTILRNLTFCKADIEAFKPDVLVLIDYPGFNLRIAEWAKKSGYKVVYYISPQVWAWKESRVKRIRRSVDKMLVILPFEKDFYEKRWNYKVHYVGHPLVQVVDEYLAMHPTPPRTEQLTVAILPGSRAQEVRIKLPIMLKATEMFPECRFVIARAASLDASIYEGLTAGYKNVRFVTNETYHLLSIADAALVTSGTATLETALFGVPQVVCYRGSAISYGIAKRLVKIKYISLVNLIMDRLVVTELIQDDLTSQNIAVELGTLLFDPARKQQLKQDYRELKDLLQKGGNASRTAAEATVQVVAINSSTPV